MTDPCTDATCESAAFPHYHMVSTNHYGDPVQCIVSTVDHSNGGQVVRDPDTGEIIFPARKNRMHIVREGTDHDQ